MDIILNGELAKKYGVNSAIFIRNLYYWISKNACNGKHYYDGRYWAYNSIEAFAKNLDFWSEGQIRRIIDNLKKAGVLLVGNFNDHKYDRTVWYSLSDEIFEFYGENLPQTPEKSDMSKSTNGFAENDRCICRNQQMDLPKSANAFDENDRPIPKEIPNIIPKDNPPISPHEKDEDWKNAWEAFIEMRKKKKSPLTDRAKTLIFNKLKPYSKNEQVEMLNEAIIHNWLSVYPRDLPKGNKENSWEGVTRL